MDGLATLICTPQPWTVVTQAASSPSRAARRRSKGLAFSMAGLLGAAACTAPGERPSSAETRSNTTRAVRQAAGYTWIAPATRSLSATSLTITRPKRAAVCTPFHPSPSPSSSAATCLRTTRPILAAARTSGRRARWRWLATLLFKTYLMAQAAAFTPPAAPSRSMPTKFTATRPAALGEGFI